MKDNEKICKAMAFLIPIILFSISAICNQCAGQAQQNITNESVTTETAEKVKSEKTSENEVITTPN